MIVLICKAKIGNGGVPRSDAPRKDNNLIYGVAAQVVRDKFSDSFNSRSIKALDILSHIDTIRLKATNRLKV